jgi:hypothetical protein
MNQNETRLKVSHIRILHFQKWRVKEMQQCLSAQLIYLVFSAPETCCHSQVELAQALQRHLRHYHRRLVRQLGIAQDARERQNSQRRWRMTSPHRQQQQYFHHLAAAASPSLGSLSPSISEDRPW